MNIDLGVVKYSDFNFNNDQKSSIDVNLIKDDF